MKNIPKNTLIVALTNTKVNSMIGDEQLPLDVNYKSFPGTIEKFPDWLATPEKRTSGRKTFATYKYFDKDSVLEPSGLIGPVKIEVRALKVF